VFFDAVSRESFSSPRAKIVLFLHVFLFLIIIPIMGWRTNTVLRGRCTANEQFISLDHGDTDVGSDLTGLEWIGDVESFMCSRQIGEDGDEVDV
jgi:hypothetical protein